MHFNDLPLREEILRAITEIGYEDATEIQEKAIPPVLEGRDVIGRSSTGTGKTAAFGIPCVQMASENADKSTVLILSPTRELAVQTAGELRKYAKYLSGVGMAVLYGGASMETQIYQLKTARIVIGTPGRIMDHLRRKTLKLANLRTVVLDEADEMLNMGFIDDIHSILETAPAEHQTVLFSATMPAAIVKITEEFQHDPVHITVNVGQKTALSIEQSYYNIPQAGKQDALRLLLEFHRPKRSLVFCNTKKMVDELCASLCDSGFKAVGLHGDLKQVQRNSVMNEFKSGRSNILIATDVAARGIDVDDVEAVFNYDIPQEYEYYIHRIGRTGRAGRAGASYTLAANRNQLSRVREIERYIDAPIKEKSVPTIESIADSRMNLFTEEIRTALADGVDEGWRSYVDTLVTEGLELEDICAVLCQKLNRKGNKRLASVHNVSGATGKKSYVAAAGRVWMRMDVGSNQKLAPNFVVSAIGDASGLPGSVIGKINIYADHTDVDLAKDDADKILPAMEGVQIKGHTVHCSLTNEAGRTQGGGFGGRNRFDRDRAPRRGGRFPKRAEGGHASHGNPRNYGEKAAFGRPRRAKAKPKTN